MQSFLRRVRYAVRGVALLALLTSLLVSDEARAATYYWDANSTTPGFGTASGTWGSSAFWTLTSGGGSPHSGVTNTVAGDIVNFGNGATGLATGTINVTGAAQNFTSMTFASGSGDITITGGTSITMGAAATITTNNTQNTINTLLNGGATSLTKAGTGKLTLGGISATAASNYSGTTILNGGTLAINHASTAALTGGLTVGASIGNTTTSALDLTAGSASFAGVMTVQTHSTTANTISIGNGKSLTTTNAVNIGNSNTTNTTKLTVSGTGSAAWNVTASGTTFRVGGGAVTTLDMNALPNFTADLGTTGIFRIRSELNNNVVDNNTVILANTSTITAGSVEVGSNAYHGAVHTLTLGTGVNTINANTIGVGANGTVVATDNRGSGLINFYDSSLGSVKIRAANGTGRAAMDLVNNTVTSGVGQSGTVLLAGHNADLLLSTLTIASRGGNISANSVTGTMTFDTGLFDATTVVLSNRNGPSFAGGSTTGNLTLGGGTVTIGTLTMATNSASLGSASNTGDAVANLDISGGTVALTTLTMGVNTVNPSASGSNTNSTINISGGATTVSTTFTMGAQNSAASAATTVNNAISTLNISNGSLTLSGSTNLTMAATTLDANNTATGTINITGGSLTVGGNIQFTDGTGAESNTVTLNGGLLDMTSGNIGGAGGGGAGAGVITFNAQSGTLQNLAQLNGGATLTKTTTGTLILTGTNAYTGLTDITSGVVNIRSNTALGGTGTGTTVASGATLQLQGTITVGAEALSLTGVGAAGENGALVNVSGTNNYGGLITLGGATTIASNSGTLNLTNTGTITGAGADLTLTGAGGGSVASIIGTTSGGLTKDGAGTWGLSGTSSNTYTGLTTVNAGTLELAKTANLNAFNGHLVIGDGVGTDTVVLINANQIPNASDVTINSGGVLNLSANSEQVSRLIGSGMVTSSGTPILTVGATTDAAFGGNIVQTGGGTLTFQKNNTNTITLTGTGSNYGALLHNNGVIEFDNQAALGSLTGSVRLGNVTGGTGSPTLRYLATAAAAADLSGRTFTINRATDIEAVIENLATNPAATLKIGAVTTDITGSSLSVKSLTLTGTNTGANTVSGVISNGTAASGGLSLLKSGGGTWILSNANTYSGATTISGGTLSLGTTGSLNNSAVTVQAGGTFAGSGSVKSLNVQVGGFHRPGNSPGITTVNGDYTMAGTLVIEIDGTAGAGLVGGHDQVVVNNDGDGSLVTLSGLLSVDPAMGLSLFDTFTIIDNNGGSPISGVFSGLAEGASFWASIYQFSITYVGGAGNDVVLTVSDIQAAAVPEPSSLGLLGGLAALALWSGKRKRRRSEVAAR